MNTSQIRDIVANLTSGEKFPNFGQLQTKYGLMDAIAIQAGIGIAALQARANAGSKTKVGEEGFTYYEEDQQHFPE
ncbi:MAG: hypothetical protein WAV40_01575 [Microgenomates group bacterium]